MVLYDSVIYKFFRLTVFVMFCVMACGVSAQQKAFPMPQIPTTLSTPAERANYLAIHYWDLYDFSEETLSYSGRMSEQAFTDFISIMPYVTERDSAFTQFVSRITDEKRVLRRFFDIAQKYLAEVASPVYNEPLYILFLQKLVESEKLKLSERELYAHELKMACKNRVGEKAADFSFTMRNDKRGRLSRVEAEYLLLCFVDPECDACVEVKEALAASPVIGKMVDNGALKILAVCVEGDQEVWRNSSLPKKWINAFDEKGDIFENQLYDIYTLPMLYLLNNDKIVLLKDVKVRFLEKYLSELQ